MTTPVLWLNGVSHAWGGGRRRRAALNTVHLTVAAGQALAVVGESGSGKSTLARIACGLLRPTVGSVHLNGQPLTAPDRRVQPLFQEAHAAFDPRWTIGASVAEGLRRPWHQVQGPVLALLGDVGLGPEVATRLPAQCSGGQLQRAALARALAAAPHALVADEPTAGLDPPTAAQIAALLITLRDRGLAILYLGHDLGLARRLCAQMAVLYRGRVVESGDGQALWTAPAHPYTRLLWDSLPGRGARSAPLPDPDPGAGWSGDARGCPFVPRCPHAGPRCHQEQPALIPLRPSQAVACHRAEDLPPWRPAIPAHPAP